MKIIDFVKKYKEIFIVNFITLGLIALTLPVQFGVHIKVDEGVDLVPVKLEYIQSQRYFKRQGVKRVSERYVILEYENNEQKPFWMPASVVFGRAGEDEIKDMIKDGDSIKRNVFINTKSDEVIGVTKSGKSILSLYYHNSYFFRNGIWAMIIVDTFLGLMIKLKNKKSKTTIDMYRYYPEDKKKLELSEILFKMRDFRILFVCTFPVWVIWGIFVFVFFNIDLMSDLTAKELVVFSVFFLITFLILLGVTIAPVLIAKFKNEKKRIIENANQYLSNVGEDFIEQLQADLNKGLPFMKKRNPVISDSYIIGSITEVVLNPIAIPKEQIREIAYAYYEPMGSGGGVMQGVYFRLKNGKEISMPINDTHNLELTLKALKDCRTPIIDISQKAEEKSFGRH